MGLMTWQDLTEARKKRDAAQAGPEGAPEADKPAKGAPGLAAGIFAGCPGLSAEKEAALIGAGYDSIEALAGAAHSDVVKLLGPKLSGAARGWAGEELRKRG